MNYYIPLVLVGILTTITLILIGLDKLLGGSGERLITINRQTKVPVLGDDTVLHALAANKIFIPSACGGKATCGACKFKLMGDAGDILPTEEPFLSATEREEGVRLACQVKVRGDMQIEIPDALLSAKEYDVIVDHVEDLTYDIKLVRCQLIGEEVIDFKPGQYAQLRVPGMDVIRAYSIASNPSEKESFELIIRMVPRGLATTYVHRALEVGDRLTVTGPFGDFYLREGSDREIICIAGGSGKAPIRSIVHYLKDRGMPRKVKYFFGARAKRDLYYTEEFMDIAREFPNFMYIPALSAPNPEDEWEGETGLITDVVDRHTGDLSQAEAYLCGSPGMIDACIKVLTRHGIKEENVFYDKF